MHELQISTYLSEAAIYRPIMMKFGTHNEKKNMPSPIKQNRNCAAIFKYGRTRHLENQLNGIDRPFLFRF
jgi:hypothetical protein